MANDSDAHREYAVIDTLLRDVERTADLVQRLLDRMADASVDRERLSVHVEILQRSVARITDDLAALRGISSKSGGRIDLLEGDFGHLEGELRDLSNERIADSEAAQKGRWALLAAIGGAIAAGVFSVIEALLGMF